MGSAMRGPRIPKFWCLPKGPAVRPDDVRTTAGERRREDRVGQGTMENVETRVEYTRKNERSRMGRPFLTLEHSYDRQMEGERCISRSSEFPYVNHTK